MFFHIEWSHIYGWKDLPHSKRLDQVWPWRTLASGLLPLSLGMGDMGEVAGCARGFACKTVLLDHWPCLPGAQFSDLSQELQESDGAHSGVGTGVFAPGGLERNAAPAPGPRAAF